MDNFLDLLKEYECDKHVIRNFKTKLNKTVKYKQHLTNFEFTEKWFSKLDYILTELGYRALDKHINYIKKKVRKLIILEYEKDGKYTHHLYWYGNVYRINDLYSDDEFIQWLILNYPEKMICRQLSKSKSDIAIKYLIDNPNKIYEREFRNNKNPIAVKYVEETNLCKVPKPKEDSIFMLITNDGMGDMYLTYRRDHIGSDTCILSMWYLHKFDQLNWLPRSGLKFFQ